MKHYFEYMDNINVSDTLHQRLVNLEAPQKRTPAWKKYGVAAAALALVVGVGAWGLSRGGWDAIETNFHPLVDYTYTSVPEIADIGDPARPDIAIEDPNDVPEPGMKTDGGYEIADGEMAAYYFLPYIDYGMTKNVSQAQMSLDWDLPAGCTRRDLTPADIAALFGGENTLSGHLGWGGYELSGWAAWYGDGSLWGMYLYGYKGALDHFEFAFTAGNTYPPTCIGYPDGVEQQLWDLTVTAYGHNGQNGCDRRVEFLTDGYGFRFDITGSDVEQTCNIVSRLVRWIAVEGLETRAVTADGAVPAHPWEADPSYSVGEPNWQDSVSEYDSDCPYCADGTVHTHPYNPQAADSSYNAPSMETRSPGGPDDN